jgi:DNA-binding NtrC family response regulator
VADDEGNVRLFRGSALQRAGYDCTLAGSGEQALELFRAGPERFEAVVLDQWMGGKSGEDTLEAIAPAASGRAHCPDQRLLRGRAGVLSLGRARAAEALHDW